MNTKHYTKKYQSEKGYNKALEKFMSNKEKYHICCNGEGAFRWYIEIVERI